MKPNLRAWLLSTSMSLLTGCSLTPPKTFTFQADVPENFTVTGTGNYIPAPGETCTGRSGKPFRVGRLHFKPDQPKTAHQVEFKVPLTDNEHGCSSVLHSLKLTIEGRWGPGREHTSQESANFSISDETSQQASTPQVFEGQCQWLFRTMGPYRYIVKIPMCRALNANGDMEKRMIGGRLHRDQLADSTVRLVLSVAKEEEPYFNRYWIKTAAGWKPCKGNWGRDIEELCVSPPQFKNFKMPDGRDCPVYPNCTEQEQ
ncbi:hypothetical protein AA042_12325 [Pseudomonas lundensis]|uniref:hypothetical protein n=1 Tax=Pseudomonas lundensis TaxID=86185 RepID=UPI00069AF7F6|nr:hypothetical protein [Pseudomonas lundensis]AOZ13350.1 hypothetical protein AA042_12325 [Pseudomonas lundensis]